MKQELQFQVAAFITADLCSSMDDLADHGKVSLNEWGSGA